MTDPGQLDAGWFAEQNRDAWLAGRQSVFADLQAAYDRGHDVGLGADTEHRALVHAIMGGPGRDGIGYDAQRHATIDGFNAGSLARKQAVADMQQHELDKARAARAEQQAQLGDPEREAEAG